MAKTKKVVGMKVVSPGSPPDIDSDFSVTAREKAVEYVTELYGKDNVANIVTFGTLATKSAFKSMCTIYEVPFAQANRVASMIPDGDEGHEVTFDDIYNEDSDYYKESADFREATSGDPKWDRVITGARGIAGRVKSTGVHACGIIISAKPLTDTVPLHIRKKDGKVITQWTYQECEALGLIKMDFLGLDTVDLIQHTIEYIQKSGKDAPNMIAITQGKMDDPEVYRLFQEGHTVGVFQFGSEMVRNLLRQMKPTEFNDLAACTAVARPGPMGMNSHAMYAERKNGLAKIEALHPDFKGSPLEKILSQTYGLCIYQEQSMRIASEIAGMTLQEGDKLRKAMGKKKHDIMMKMKPKFISGGIANGYSEESMNKLWDVLEPFSKYAFNKSHSVAYAMNAYQAAYLKTHYPVEFIAALIAQTIDKKDKTLNNLREARRMGISMGTVNINLSDVRVSPDYSGGSGFEILYGFSGVKGVSESSAEIIIKERDSGGRFTSVQDAVSRCVMAGITKKDVFINLAMAGAFDDLEPNRRKVIESIPGMLTDGRKMVNHGMDLFSLAGQGAEDTFEMVDVEDYPYVDRLRLEADMIGMYLTGHPMDRIGGSTGLDNVSIKSLSSLKKRQKVKVVAAVSMESKNTRRGKMVTMHLDDGTGLISTRVTDDVVKGMDKTAARNDIRARFCRGDLSIPKTVIEKAFSDVTGLPDVQNNGVYLLTVDVIPAWGGKGDPMTKVSSIQPVTFAHDGSLPVRVRVNYGEESGLGKERASLVYRKLPGFVRRQCPGDSHLMIARYNSDKSQVSEEAFIRYALDIIKRDARQAERQDSSEEVSQQEGLLSDDSKSVKKKPASKKKTERQWPTSVPSRYAEKYPAAEDIQGVVDSLEYVNTSMGVEKSEQLKILIEDKVGHENYDFGIYVPVEDEND